MSAAIPKWVYDLVIALQQHEDVHGEKASCLAPVLKLVPAEVGRDAEAIRRYAEMATGDAVMTQARGQWTGLADMLAPQREDTP